MLVGACWFGHIYRPQCNFPEENFDSSHWLYDRSAVTKREVTLFGIIKVMSDGKYRYSLAYRYFFFKIIHHLLPYARHTGRVKRISDPYQKWRTQVPGTDCSRRPFYQHGFTLIPAWIINYSHYYAWDKIIYPYPNFNGCTVEVWEWISNFIPLFTGHMITDPCWYQS